MHHRAVPIPTLPTYTRIAERPGAPWAAFPFPEYPGASAAYLGTQPRIMQDTTTQLLKMKGCFVHEESAMAVCNSPLVQIKRAINLGEEVAPARVLAKLEGCIHCHSAKARAASAVLREAEFQGFLKKGMHVIEPVDHVTVDNGTAIASVCASMGYPCVLVMPAGISMSMQNIMRRLGAKIVQTKMTDGFAGAVAKIEDMMQKEKTKYFVARMFTEEASVRAHEVTTATEIWDATAGRMDCLVCGVLTGATLTGIRRLFESRGKRVHTVAVEPAESAVLSSALEGTLIEPSRHNMAGMGCGHVPGLLDLKLVDKVERVTEAEALEMAERLGAQEGILTGLAGGAVMAAASRIANEPHMVGFTIVCILPVGYDGLVVDEVHAMQQALEAERAEERPLSPMLKFYPGEVQISGSPQQPGLVLEADQSLGLSESSATPSRPLLDQRDAIPEPQIPEDSPSRVILEQSPIRPSPEESPLRIPAAEVVEVVHITTVEETRE